MMEVTKDPAAGLTLLDGFGVGFELEESKKKKHARWTVVLTDRDTGECRSFQTPWFTQHSMAKVNADTAHLLELMMLQRRYPELFTGTWPSQL